MQATEHAEEEPRTELRELTERFRQEAREARQRSEDALRDARRAQELISANREEDEDGTHKAEL